MTGKTTAIVAWQLHDRIYLNETRYQLISLGKTTKSSAVNSITQCTLKRVTLTERMENQNKTKTKQQQHEYVAALIMRVVHCKRAVVFLVYTESTA